MLHRRRFDLRKCVDDVQKCMAVGMPGLTASHLKDRLLSSYQQAEPLWMANCTPFEI